MPQCAAVRHGPTRASITLLLCLTWLAPGVAMLGAVVHDDHDEHGHHELALELATASTHGHHHEAATPAHDHGAVRPAAPAAATPAVCAAPLAPSTIGPPAPAAARFERRPPSTGSPPLFRSHCALLL